MSAALVAALVLSAASAEASVKSKILYSRGVLELNAGRTQAALDLFNQAVAEDPSDAYALYYRGVTRGQQGDSDGAIADLTASLNAQPTFKRAALELGIALVQKGEYGDAIELLERARESEELEARASFFLGASFILFVYNMVISWTRGPIAEANPWRGRTLEWQVSSPPPIFNFDEIPQVVGNPYEYGVPGARHAVMNGDRAAEPEKVPAE